MPGSLADLRLGFLSGRPATIRGSAIFVDAGMGRLIDALRMRCPRLVVALSEAPQRMEMHDHQLSIRIDELTLLPPMPSYARGFYKVWPCLRAIRTFERRCDAAIVQLPFQAPAGLLSPQAPRLYHVCADVRELAGISTAYRGARRIAAMSTAIVIDRMQRHMVRLGSSRVVANGRALFERLEHGGRAVVSSSIFEREILSVARARPKDAPFRVLFVGYLRPEKGIATLLDAFERVRSEIRDAELLIVGARPVVERTAEKQMIESMSADGAVRFAGELPFGERLFSCFADGDVLVLPSLSEGTPRVLIEARAFGCPVIASDVGGIPDSVMNEKDGLLVPPGDVDALARSILRIARDRALREALIEGGIARARRSTVDSFANEMLEEVGLLVGA